METAHRRRLLPLALCPALLALPPRAQAQDAPPAPPRAQATPAPPAGALLRREGDRLLVSLPDTAGLQPGGAVALYVEELRPDPRTPDGPPLRGLRFAGDATLAWVGEGVLELLLAPGAEVGAPGPIVLGEARGLAATPAWRAPAPPPPAVVEAPPPEAPPEPERAPRGPLRLPGLDFDLVGEALGNVHADARSSGRRQALLAWGGFAADGYGTGAGTGGLAWRLRPAKGPGLVQIGLEGLRGARWVQGEDDDEPWGREAVAGAWLWTRVDTAGIGLAVELGAGLGVDAEGLALASLLGLRTGPPDGSRLELQWEQRGRLGQRLSLDGRVALRDPLRIGARARLGDLPQHDGDLKQLRSDGALLFSWDLSPAVTVTAAAGLGAYDLLWADAGPVADGAVELRW